MGGLVDKTLLEQIRSANDIVDVIGSYIPLKHAGANWVALCPFHREKTPSFNVNPQRQIYHCFGCHKGGDVFRFVQDFENVGFMDAVRRLAERARIPLVLDGSPAGEASRQLRDVLLEMHEQIAVRWQNALANEAGGERARSYLAERGVSPEAVKLFRLGFAPEAWDDTVNWAAGRKYAPHDVEKAGLIVRKDNSGHYYDRFRGRLMFPICDEQGRVIAFSGRLLQPDAKAAKYVNSPETPIFSKSRVFYGLDKARRAVLEAGFAVVCEGQLDMIACFMAGVENVVAPQGTALTADHARILKRYASEAVLCFDSDEAGQNATLRSLDGLLESGLAVRVATIPAPDDPDSYIKAQGAQAFRSLIEQAPGFFDWLLDRLCRQHSMESDRGRLAIARVMAESLAKTGSAVLIDTHAQKVAARLGISSDAVRREFNRIRPGLGPAEVELETPVDDVPQPGAVELWLLRLLLSHLDLVPWAAAHLQTAWIQHPQVRRIVEGLYRVVEEDQWSGVADFVNGFDDGSLQGLITQCAAAGQPIHNPAQQLPDIAVKLRNASLEVELAELQRRVGSPDLSEERRIEILQRQQAIRLLRRQSLPPVTD
ncbi:MAG: DNA primase [Verrucomicrobia bacterium]|nr:DNA primase [Verrucomicrobiota bacterium]